MKKSRREAMEKVVLKVAKASVFLEVNSACPFLLYQPKLPKSVDALRKK